MASRFFRLILGVWLLSAFCVFPNSAMAETINLKMSHFMPTKHTQHKVMEKWAETVEEESGGRLKVTIYPGGALGKPPDQYDSAVKGITDIAFGLQSYTAGRFPLTSVLRLPFMVSSGEQGSAVLWDLYQKYLKDEYQDAKVLWMFCHGPGQIMTTRKEVKTLQDMKGLKLRTPGAVMSRVLRAFGAIPVTTPITQVYTGLERRTLDGLSGPWEIMLPFKLYEKVQYVTEANIYTQTFFMAMNKEKYESLPEDLRKIIDANSGKEMSIRAGKAYDAADEPSREVSIENGVSVYTLPEAERARWKEAAMPIRENWVTEMEAKGLPGREVLDYTLKALKKY
jgi:TRAP-type C4-dicarboxylate transport system substrate-binding protein